jgi:hypothetical protein
MRKRSLLSERPTYEGRGIFIEQLGNYLFLSEEFGSRGRVAKQTIGNFGISMVVAVLFEVGGSSICCMMFISTCTQE